MNKQTKNKTETTPIVPLDFVDLMAGAGAAALAKWLKAKGLGDAAELAQCVETLYQYELFSAEGHDISMMSPDIPGDVASVARILGQWGVEWQYGAEDVASFDALESKS